MSWVGAESVGTGVHVLWYLCGQGTTLGNQLSSSAVYVLGTNSDGWTGWQAPLPTEPSRRPRNVIFYDWLPSVRDFQVCPSR